jgi:hypothetical protein
VLLLLQVLLLVIAAAALVMLLLSAVCHASQSSRVTDCYCASSIDECLSSAIQSNFKPRSR